MSVKNYVEAIGFFAGSLAGFLFGPMDVLFQGMLVLMAVDVFVGLIDAFSGVSSKTDAGGVSSQAMVKGIAKKCGELVMVIVGNTLDMITGMAVVRSGVCVAIIVAETISITENVTLLGVVDIPIINEALEILKKKGGDDDGAV